MGDEVNLPADNANLETAYSEQDYLDVASKNDIRVAQTATGQYAIHLFKDLNTVASTCMLEWEGQTDVDPADSPVYLQIYNHDSSTWETVDVVPATYGSSLATYGGSGVYYVSPGADTDFILSASISNLTNYKDGNSVVSCRVYQLSV
jgi:hypothetical protein